MKTWATIIKEATLEAGREHIRLKTNFNNPIDIFSIVESKKIVLMFQPLGALAGAYIPADNEEGTPAGILINEKLPITKQRYSAAHEYCHFLRKDPESLDTEAEMFELKEYKNNDAERIAESFAGRFLMPRPLVLNMMKKLEMNPKELTPVSVYTLSLRLGTSYSSTLNQLSALKLISETKYRQLTVTPKKIKELMGNTGLESYWNDIWQLVKSDNGNRISPKLGDILKLDLEENPTTGYSWTGCYSSGLEVIEEKWGAYNGVGSGGNKQIRLKVTEPIVTDIELIHARPWKKDEILESLKISLETDIKRHGVKETLLTG